MDLLLNLWKFIYRIKYWLILLPLAVAILVYMLTGNLQRNYNVSTTIYTGVASGFNIESGETMTMSWNLVNNAMDNLINIVRAQTTLQQVSMRLYAKHMMYGDPNEDNNYITARHYREELARTPADVLALIDKTSEAKTLENLQRAYDNPEKRGNHVYGLFNWHHKYYSFEALSKIIVNRVGNSDMLEVKYSTDDPGVAYTTLMLLNEAFLEQYSLLRFGETNNVVEYFRKELARVGKELRAAEDSLTQYNMEKKVINYDEQTTHVAALSRDYELQYERILLDYNSSKALLKELDKRIATHTKQLQNNGLFISKLNNISDLTAKITTIESFGADSSLVGQQLGIYRNELNNAEKELMMFTDQFARDKYSKDGIVTYDVVLQWLAEVIRHEKAKAELEVMARRKLELDSQYVYYAPVGSTIKRKEREIDFSERTYINILHSLNAALMRQKNLQMSSATLRVLNPPILPLASIPTKRKLIVASAFLMTFFFVLAYFLLVEWFDRTLRDKFRTERVTGGKVLGAFPAPARGRYRGYSKEYVRIATNFMGNAMVNFFRQDKRPAIVNLLSVRKEEGKSTLSSALAEYWREQGMSVEVVSWYDDLMQDLRKYMLAQSLYDLLPRKDVDVIIVEYPPLEKMAVPTKLLQEASVNLLVARADRGWQDTDQLLFDRVTAQTMGIAPLFIYLNYAGREAVELFTGQLPPYNMVRNFAYRFFQFGFTGKR